MRREVRIAGFGGQGIILAGVILCHAAGLYEGLEVAQTQSYGPEARGGACRSEVVISDEPIDYIKVSSPDIMVAMSQQALEKYSGDIDPERVAVLVDSTLVEEVPGSLERVYQLPATELAEETLGRRLVANMLMLGAVSKLADFVTAESLGKAVETQVPPNTVELNLKALEAGRRGLARLL